MKITEIDNKIINVLQNEFPNFTVESFPNNFDDYIFSSPEGCILSKYVKRNFSSSKTIGVVNQNAKISFEIFIGRVYLSCHQEIYNDLDKLDATLTAIEIDGFKKAQITDSRLVEEGERILWHAYTIEFESKNVEQLPKEKISALDAIYEGQKSADCIKNMIAKRNAEGII